MNSMLDKRTHRWLLRVLCDDAFLRLYVEDHHGAEPLTTSEVERALWSLPEGPEHQPAHRMEAWCVLREHILNNSPTPAHRLFVGTFKYLHDRRTDDDTRRLSAFYGVDFLFDENSPHSIEPQAPIQSADGTHFTEIHAHFRGSVPLDFIWTRLMQDARLRALHRREFVTTCAWSKTRAELLALASELTGPSETPNDALKGALGDLRGTDEREPMLPRIKRSMALLALRANFGHHLIYQRGETGLTLFTRAYKRYSDAARSRGASSGARTEDDLAQVTEVLNEFHRRGVRGVELRPTVDATRIQIQAKLRPLVLGYLCHVQQSIDPLTFGIVPSFFKQEGLQEQRDYNKATSEDWVFEQSDRWRRQAYGLMEVLARVPALRLFVVGIDAAGCEQGCPVRALSPAYAVVVDENRRQGLASATPGRRMRPWLARLRELLPSQVQDETQRRVNAWRMWEALNDGWTALIPPIRLGLTIHVGEDFIDPITGLREIWEAIDHLGLTRGDRLGHALAAGLSPNQLKQVLERRAASPTHRFVEESSPGNFRLAKPLGVHLVDEAWSNRLLGDCGRGVSLAASRTFSMDDARRGMLVDLQGSGPATTLRVPGLHFPKIEQVPSDYLTWITIDDEYKRRFQKLRELVADKIRGTGLVVESCPTSNLVVAGMNEPPLTTFLDGDFAVTIASDDPAIFNAWPDHELLRFARDGTQRDRLINRSEHASFI